VLQKAQTIQDMSHRKKRVMEEASPSKVIVRNPTVQIGEEKRKQASIGLDEEEFLTSRQKRRKVVDSEEEESKGNDLGSEFSYNSSVQSNKMKKLGEGQK